MTNSAKDNYVQLAVNDVSEILADGNHFTPAQQALLRVAFKKVIERMVSLSGTEILHND